jgi:hypothetical protein
MNPFNERRDIESLLERLTDGYSSWNPEKPVKKYHAGGGP